MEAKRSNDIKSVVIVGAGISGLSCAYELKQRCPQLRITILEKAELAGGVIKSLNIDETLIECGPESFSTLKPDVLELARQLKISHRVIQTRAENRRSFVSLEKQLHSLPEGFMMFAPANLWSFALTEIFSLGGKMRMAMDLLIPKSDGKKDESLAEFVTRRLGKEALQKLAEPMIGGIYGGDAEMLSARSTVPQLVELEKQHGSIIKGLMKARRKEKLASSGPRYGALSSFDGGISVLVKALLDELPAEALLKSKTVKHIIKGRNSSRWTVLCSDNSSYSSDYVVLATPAQQSALLLSEINPGLACKLERIPRSSAIIINLVYDRCQIKHPLNGFGFVVPRSENMLVSACSFSNIKFEGRADEKRVLLRLFTGGVLKSESMILSDSQLIQKAHTELQSILGIEGNPKLKLVTRHQDAIPQYLLGHSELVQQIDKERLLSPGIELVGNSFTGVGLPDCLRTARAAAERIAAEIA